MRLTVAESAREAHLQMVGPDTCSEASEPTWTVIPSQEEEQKLEEVPIEVSSFQGEEKPEDQTT